jgi:hypothetical protein
MADKRVSHKPPTPTVAVPPTGEMAKAVPETKTLPFQPGAESGRVDVTGIVPDDIHIDPDLTEGHPGYEESGDSEIISAERLARGRSPEPGNQGE